MDTPSGPSTRSSTPDSKVLEVSSSDTKTDTYQQASEAKNFLLNVMSSNGELHHFDKIWELICKCTDEDPVVFLDWVNLPAYANNANNVNNFNIVRAALGPANLQFYTPEILKNCLLDRLLMQGVVRVDDTSCLQCKDVGSLVNLMKRMIEIACSNWMQALTGNPPVILCRTLVCSRDIYVSVTECGGIPNPVW